MAIRANVAANRNGRISVLTVERGHADSRQKNDIQRPAVCNFVHAITRYMTPERWRLSHSSLRLVAMVIYFSTSRVA